MSIWVILKSQVKSEKYDDLMGFLEKNLPRVRSFPGCFGVSVQRSSDDRTMLFQERWLSRSHHESYLESISQNGVMEALAGFLEKPPEILYLEDVDI
ncbi:hypothetical protein BTA51_06020 [Hahella sp. CCB-MM4]|uniref:putative quinol monooxygenase n=1 Tax=Hahella sp. (strain CCB-MM4) TaxID=1926491 RepID=UPI000BD27455|nr:antibiotic biosynthesis monooxygenase family protein [Hahella sp. CCB-MM4]OZG74552.1 hypothetical protein BTA51_06020 [Hahella sp. CCB-MM4]